MNRIAFTNGQCYSRKRIAKQLGGDTQSYLPHKNGSVVCGCFRTDFNPAAPFEILPGEGDEIKHWAEVFASQTEPVPVFLRRGTNQWEFVGLWHCTRKVENAATIKAWEQKTGRNDISMILRLEKLNS